MIRIYILTFLVPLPFSPILVFCVFIDLWCHLNTVSVQLLQLNSCDYIGEVGIR